MIEDYGFNNLLQVFGNKYFILSSLPGNDMIGKFFGFL